MPGAPFPSGRRRVLVTLGTHLLWAKKAMVESVVALSLTMPDVQFVVSLGAPEQAGEAPATAAPGVIVYPFVPYARDLAAFDAVVHHGGAGITYAAILAGVPSLVVPHDYDQFDFAARIAHHGLGLRAKAITERDLSRVLDRSGWPALARFQELAARYRPVEEFLAVVGRR